MKFWSLDIQWQHPLTKNLPLHTVVFVCVHAHSRSSSMSATVIYGVDISRERKLSPAKGMCWNGHTPISCWKTLMTLQLSLLWASHNIYRCSSLTFQTCMLWRMKQCVVDTGQMFEEMMHFVTWAWPAGTVKPWEQEKQRWQEVGLPSRLDQYGDFMSLSLNILGHPGLSWWYSILDSIQLVINIYLAP